VVGYDDRGFWVQNSWGPDWGENGLALWTYEDWIENVMDAWVVRLALPTPQIFGKQPRSSVLLEETSGAAEKTKVDRLQIAGHFVHIDDGRFHEQGRYWSCDDDVEQTARLVASSPDYDHLLIYAHGGLNSPAASARRIHAMRDVFKRNRIYPFHVMYDTGFAEELKDLLRRKGQASTRRVGGFADWSDRFLEGLLRQPGRMIWEEIKKDAKAAFRAKGAGTRSLRHFMCALNEPRAHKKRIHLVGHSTGGVLFAHLLETLAGESLTIETCTLLAPACTVDQYREHYLPALGKSGKLRLRSLQALNLRDCLERDDTVAEVYRKSLLYLVSNAFETKRGQPLLGMQECIDAGLDDAGGKVSFHYSDGVGGNVTRSRTHGGFDNDVTTMNHVLRTVLGERPKKGFTAAELRYRA
jgi:pimeloyl-ACP methyl ester carboxylesterase